MRKPIVSPRAHERASAALDIFHKLAVRSGYEVGRDLDKCFEAGVGDQVAACLVYHHDTNPAVAALFKDPAVARHICWSMRPDCPEYRKTMAAGGGWRGAYAVHSGTETPVAELLALAKDSDPHVLSALLKRKELPESVLAELSGAVDWQVRRGACTHSSAPDSLVVKMMGDESALVAEQARVTILERNGLLAVSALKAGALDRRFNTYSAHNTDLAFRVEGDCLTIALPSAAEAAELGFPDPMPPLARHVVDEIVAKTIAESGAPSVQDAPRALLKAHRVRVLRDGSIEPCATGGDAVFKKSEFFARCEAGRQLIVKATSAYKGDVEWSHYMSKGGQGRAEEYEPQNTVNKERVQGASHKP